MTTNIDQALTDLSALQSDLIEMTGQTQLSYRVESRVSRVIDHVEIAVRHLEAAVRIDDTEHPEDLNA